MSEIEKWRIQTNVWIGLLIFSIALFGFIGDMSYEDALAEEREYCENVIEGVWPDFRGEYENICKKYEKGIDNETATN